VEPSVICKWCKKPKKVPVAFQKGVPRSVYELDPYCSRPCAEAGYRAEKNNSPPPGRVEGDRRGRQRAESRPQARG
jgi:hypothetical protein